MWSARDGPRYPLSRSEHHDCRHGQATTATRSPAWPEQREKIASEIDVTPRPILRRSVRKIDVISRPILEEREKDRRYAAAHPEKIRERRRRYEETHPEKIRERNRRYRETNPRRYEQKDRRYREANPEKLRERDGRYHEANREKRLAKARRYREANIEKLRESKRRYWEANREKCSEAGRRYREANREKCRLWRVNDYRRRLALQRRVTLEEMDAIARRQNGRCAICRTPFSLTKRAPNLDHCHKTGKTRGLLCVACNHGMGLLKDDPKLLRAAIRYLKEHADTDATPVVAPPSGPNQFAPGVARRDPPGRRIDDERRRMQ